MGESATPEPFGRPGSPSQTPADSGLGGPGARPGPIGVVPLQTMPTGPTVTQELNLVGNFPKPASWTAQKEVQLIQSGKWFPNTPDFLAVAGKGSIEIKNTWDFLLKILAAKNKISRLDFFSHGVTGAIVLAGQTRDDGSNVDFSSNPDTKWTQVLVPGKNSKAIMDPFAGKWGDLGENSGTASVTSDSGVSFTLDDVRNKFAAGATFWLYLCHSSADPVLFQQVANTFQVTAKGFSSELVYCAPPAPPFPTTSRAHTMAVVSDPKNPAGSCPGKSDFRQLDSDPKVRTAAPQKP
jgi:hypothetical protein